jgi:hypothetical protein
VIGRPAARPMYWAYAHFVQKLMINEFRSSSSSCSSIRAGGYALLGFSKASIGLNPPEGPQGPNYPYHGLQSN